MSKGQKRSGQAIRITTAAANRADDIRARQKRYLLSMSLRTLCFVGAILASFAGLDWLWPFLIGGAIVLPYIAVVMANAAANLSDGFRLREADFTRLQLEQGREQRARAAHSEL